MEPVIFFASSPRLEELGALTVSTAGCCLSLAPMQPRIIKCREMIFTEPDILASPSMDMEASFHLIAQRSVLKTGRLQTRLQKQGLTISSPYPVQARLYQECLLYSMKARLAPSWNVVGEWFLQGRDFLTYEGYTNAIKMDVQVSHDEVFISLMAAVVRFPPMQVEDLNVSRHEMLQIIRSAQGDGDKFKVELDDCWCHVMPSLKKARVVSLSLTIPEESPFRSYPLLKRYWKNTYGYRLPDTDDDILFCQVAFYHNGPGKLFTYPSVCLRTEPMQTVSRINPKPILAAFLQDLRVKHSKACGQSLRFEPKGRQPGISLYTAKQNTPAPNLITKSSQWDQHPLRSSDSLSRLYQKASGPSPWQRQICQAKGMQADVIIRNRYGIPMTQQSSSHSLHYNPPGLCENYMQERLGGSFPHACNRVDVIPNPRICTANYDNVANANAFALDQLKNSSNVPKESNQSNSNRTSKDDKPKAIQMDQDPSNVPQMPKNKSSIGASKAVKPNDIQMDQIHLSSSCLVPCINYPFTNDDGRQESLSKQTDKIPKYVPIFRPKPKAASKSKVLSSCNQLEVPLRHRPQFKNTNSKSQPVVSVSKKQRGLASRPEHSTIRNKNNTMLGQKVDFQYSEANILKPTGVKAYKNSSISKTVFSESAATHAHFLGGIQTSSIKSLELEATKPSLAEMVKNNDKNLLNLERLPREQTCWSKSKQFGTSSMESPEPGIFEAKTSKTTPIFKSHAKSNCDSNQISLSQRTIQSQPKAMSPFLPNANVKTCLPSPANTKFGQALPTPSKPTQSKRLATDQNGNGTPNGTPKKPRSKPGIQAVDIETLAKANQLAKVNTATLLTWLKERCVRCTTKDKKSDLIDKVRTHLQLATI